MHISRRYRPQGDSSAREIYVRDLEPGYHDSKAGLDSGHLLSFQARRCLEWLVCNYRRLVATLPFIWKDFSESFGAENITVDGHVSFRMTLNWPIRLAV